jgi:hypothetical protein
MPTGWFGKLLLCVLGVWLLTIAWFWVAAPSVGGAPNGGRVTCANFPIVKTLTGHPDRPQDQRFQPELEHACRSAEDRASLIGFYILGGGIVALVGVAFVSGRSTPSARKRHLSKVGA